MNSKKIDKYIKRFMKGDQDAFNVIYHETYTYVYLTIRNYTGSVVYVEDLIQETYMKVIDSLESYTLGTNFYAWVTSIARNLTINYLKNRNRVEIRDITDPCFEKEIENLEISHYLDKLLDNEKEIVIYHLVFGFNFKKISELTGLSYNQVYYTYKKAVERIRGEF
ncbi:MAG: RNA polymerase sigma factor [Coprobacillus sp.]|nr:RNA polymerase sigma factor [Coprobacillus sp.]MDY4145575.1 RNA polymerase sigma factor [Bacilli bacterium]